MMNRIPEPELMNDPGQAQAYAQADFCAPNSLFVQLFKEAFPDYNPDHILDLGCGPADITIRFARIFPNSLITGVDGASRMLNYGREAIAACGLQGHRVVLQERILPDATIPVAGFQAIISNSLLHHLADPQVLWRSIKRAAAPGAAVLVMDLKRPVSREDAARLVHTYAASEPDVLQQDFGNSLLAAYQVDEIRNQLALAGLAGLQVAEVSDRHLAVKGYLPAEP
jgi:ubiquinone/menaquinone biosynthesis C-methylase UbiE